MGYSKDLKNNDELKTALVFFVNDKGYSIAQAARKLNLSERTCQRFFNKETNWSKDWWKENEVSTHTVKLKLSGVYGEFRNEEVKVIHKKDQGEDNSRILIISDIHIPYHHPDSLEFLQYLKDKYQPTRIICMGDELDKHALSFHDHDPNLPSAGDELKISLPVIAELNRMFPVMDILESNHGSLLYRKAHANGIPKQYLKSYNEVLNVNSDWKWWYDMTITLPNGNKCYFHHGKSANVTKTSQTMSMCAVQGHYHETFKIEYWGNPNGLFWAMQTGCLINDNALAFNYNNVNLKRPIIGTGLIIDSQPLLEPMVLGEDGRWVGRK